jgi:hypothetical protein
VLISPSSPSELQGHLSHIKFPHMSGSIARSQFWFSGQLIFPYADTTVLKHSHEKSPSVHWLLPNDSLIHPVLNLKTYHFPDLLYPPVLSLSVSLSLSFDFVPLPFTYSLLSSVTCICLYVSHTNSWEQGLFLLHLFSLLCPQPIPNTFLVLDSQWTQWVPIKRIQRSTSA